MEPLLAFFLFVLLSPGFIVTLPPTGNEMKFFGSETTSQLAVIVHTVLFFSINKLIQNDVFYLGYLNKAVAEVTSTNPNHQVSDVPVLLATVLFLLFSPGLIFTIYPFGIMKEETSNLAVLVQGFAYYIFLKVYDTYKSEVWLSWLDKAVAEV